MRISISALLIIVFILSCEESIEIANKCTELDSWEDLEWLEAEIDVLKNGELISQNYFYVSQATYLDETVFIFQNCCPFCGTVIPVRDCQGKYLGILGPGDENIDTNQLSNVSIIWKPPNSACSDN